MFCNNCGKKLEEGWIFCDECGCRINSSSEQKVTLNTGQHKKFNFKFYAIAISIAIIIYGLSLFIIMAIDNKEYEKTHKKFNSLQNSYFEFLPDITIGELLNNTHSWLKPNNEGEDENMWLTMNDCPTFEGVNDETGRSFEITFAGYYNKDGNPEILEVRIDTSDSPVLQVMSDEEFEAYILDLYSSYSGNNKPVYTMITEKNTKTIKTTVTKAVSTKITTSEPAKTIASESVKTTTKKDKPQKSSDYLAYLAFIKTFSSELQREFSDTMIPYHCYYLYDIDNNGVYELLVHLGESEADSEILIYSIDENGEPIEIGEIGGGHTRLIEKDGNLCADLCHMGYQLVEKVTMKEASGSWTVTKATVSEEDNLSDYKNYGTAIKGYDISDTSAIEELCPKGLLEDKPYVNAYVKTDDFSGREGFESRLYLDGDFAYIIVESRYDADNGYEFNKYDYDETLDGIVVYQGSSKIVPTLYVTPYSKYGVAGDIVTCNIPTNASETIKTGAFSYALNSEMKGQINCNGGTVAGFTTDYVVNGGAVGKVRVSLGDKWHVTAKNVCYNYDVTWYELWDSDDGDYYGWVDENFIDFY